MLGFLTLGFLLGMGHALEADHLAAVGALAADGKPTPKKMLGLGASWGAGHTTTLFILCAFVFVFGGHLTAPLAASLEFLVGIMLVGLGLVVFYKFAKKRVHFHVHQHDGKAHLHAHSHEGEARPHKDIAHHHHHARGFSLRAYLVGLVHGAAGSAALIALSAAATQNALTALGYAFVFGIGSMAGMALLSYAVSWPLSFSARATGRIFTGVQFATAMLAITIGVRVMVENGEILRAFI